MRNRDPAAEDFDAGGDRSVREIAIQIVQYDYSLQKILPSVESFSLPDVPFDPRGSYHLTFQLLSFTIRPREVGTLELLRSPKAGTFDLEVRCKRAAQAGHQFVTTVQFECLEDTLATPQNWEAQTSLSPAEGGDPFPYTALSLRGWREAGNVVIETAGRQRRFAAGEDFSAKWTLLEGVQRLQAGFSEASFDCLDEIDCVRPSHRLTRLGEQMVSGPRDRARYHGFLHTGEAMIPRALWTDENGLLHFMTSGTEGMVLLAVGESRSSFDIGYAFKDLKLT